MFEVLVFPMEVKQTNPLRERVILRNIRIAGVSPEQGDGRDPRTLVKQRPGFGGTWHPPDPKLRGSDCHLVPMLANLTKTKRPDAKVRIIIPYPPWATRTGATIPHV